MAEFSRGFGAHRRQENPRRPLLRVQLCSSSTDVTCCGSVSSVFMGFLPDIRLPPFQPISEFTRTPATFQPYQNFRINSRPNVTNLPKLDIIWQTLANICQVPRLLGSRTQSASRDAAGRDVADRPGALRAGVQPASHPISH